MIDRENIATSWHSGQSKILFFILDIWTVGFWKPPNHIFLEVLLPSFRWRHTSRSLKIIFLQNSSCYISIDSFCWVIFDKQPYPQNVWCQAREQNLWHYNWLQKIRPKKVFLFPEVGRAKMFPSHTCPHSRMCIHNIYFSFQKKNKKEKQKKHTHTHINKKQKKLKKIEKQKKPKKKRSKKMSLLTISVENLTGYNDIAWQFALCALNLRDQLTKRERVVKSNKLWKIFACICLLYTQDESQDTLTQ